MSQPPVLVLGAGMAGLTAAAQLARRGIAHRIVEAGPRIAGMADSHVGDDGFTYDIGAHFITNRLAAACGISADCRTVRGYGERFYLGDGKEYDFPFDILRSPRFIAGAVRQQLANAVSSRADEDVHVADRFTREYGPVIANELLIPIVESWSGVPADRLSPAVANKIPEGVVKSIWLRVAQRLSHRAVAMGYCRDQPESAGVFHVYPIRGVAEVCRALAATLPAPVQTNQPAQKIYVDRGRVVGARIAERDCDASAVISTLPINRLHQIVSGSDATTRFAGFRFRALVLVNLKLEGRGLLSNTIVWTPSGFPFFRLTEAPLAMPWLAPQGKTIVLCELGAQLGDEIWKLSDDAAVRCCVDALETFIPQIQERLIGAQVMRQPLGYPIYALDYEEQRQALEQRGTGINGLVSIGRNGEFDHLLMEDIYWRTIRRVERLADDLTRPHGGRDADRLIDQP